ncbi:MAG: hypothetical protein C7B47_09345, partial [Sulfobacillus thermosulfidooxidans]
MPTLHLSDVTAILGKQHSTFPRKMGKYAQQDSKFSKIVNAKSRPIPGKTFQSAHSIRAARLVISSYKKLDVAAKPFKFKRGISKKTLSPTQMKKSHGQPHHRAKHERISHTSPSHKSPRSVSKDEVAGFIGPIVFFSTPETVHLPTKDSTRKRPEDVFLHTSSSASKRNRFPAFTSKRPFSPAVLVTKSQTGNSQLRDIKSIPVLSTHKLVFNRDFKAKAVKQTRPVSGKKSRPSGKTWKSVKSQKHRGELTSGLWDAIGSSESQRNLINLKGSITPETRVTPVPKTVDQAIRQGILQKHVGGWIIKPIHWKGPSGMPASKWSLTWPKQSGPIIMTLIHMQNSWKVHLEVNSTTLAGALAENLGQVQNMTAASLPVSQVSVFLGMGQNAMGQGNSGGSFGAPYEQPTQSVPWRTNSSTAMRT